VSSFFSLTVLLMAGLQCSGSLAVSPKIADYPMESNKRRIVPCTSIKLQKVTMWNINELVKR
jgi:hypothetical protein